MQQFSLKSFSLKTPQNWPVQPVVLIASIGLIGLLMLTYLPAVSYLLMYWKQPDYGHGYFVPIFAGVLLWTRRKLILPLPERGSWWGVAVFALAALLQWGSVYMAFSVFDPLSLILFACGLVLFLGGWRAMHWAWPSLMFLVFMLPLPGFIELQLRYPLQSIGTKITVFIIQTIGIPSGAEGNIINAPGGPILVAEACSGLRMMMMFLAICVGAALILRGPLWEKIVILVSALPLAVTSNVMRLTLTALSQEWISRDFSENVMHQWAGWLMMPFALLLLWGELVVLRRLFIESTEEMPFSLQDSLATVPLSAAPRAGTGQERPNIELR
jgi:exosortase